MRPGRSERRRFTTAAGGVWALLPTVSIFLLAGCSGGVLDPKGQIAAEQSKILLNAFSTMLIIVAPVIIGALACAYWFRASNQRAVYLPDWVFSGRLELVIWGFPLLIILFLSGLIWVGSHRLDPFRPIASAGEPLEVQVVSLDWKWLFIYPRQSVASVNEFVLPAETPVSLSLTSATVMNSFFVPQLAGMIATMPGMVTRLHLKADHVGDLWGLSTQFSGDGFAGMSFAVRVKSAEEFERWLEATRRSACRLDHAGYAALLPASRNVRPFVFGSVAPDLFTEIVSKTLSPQPASTEGEGANVACPETMR
jgi:cytochrome o ubiquinol oxidase subunit 2